MLGAINHLVTTMTITATLAPWHRPTQVQNKMPRDTNTPMFFGNTNNVKGMLIVCLNTKQKLAQHF